MINEILNLCNRPQAACDNLTNQIITKQLFQSEIDLGNALVEINTDENDELRDLFTEQWIFQFYPQTMVEALLVRNELIELADKVKERSGQSHLIYALADEYLKIFNTSLEFSTKFGYDAIPSYMVVYKVSNNAKQLINVLTTKPCTILEFLESKKITIV